MKASYHGHTFEVDSIIGKDGMEYPAQDVVLIEPDWSSFRREAAKDILCAMLGRVERFYTGVSIDGKNKISDHEDFIKLAIEDADTLIAKLKEK